MRRIILGALSFSVSAAAGANGLLDAYKLAQEQDQTFQAALHARDASIEARPQAWAALLPQLTATAEWQRIRSHQLSGNFSSSVGNIESGREYYSERSFTLNLSQTLFDWSAFQAVAQSDKTVAEAEATYRSAEQSLILRTAQAYFNVLSARDTLRADLDAQASYKQQLDENQKKFQVGLAAITDVRNAQASYDTSTALVISDRAALDNARRALGLIVGQPVDAIADLQQDIPLVAPNPVPAEAWSKAASQDNPDLMSSYYASEVARKQVAIYEGQYLPTLSAGGQFNRATQHAQSNDDSLTDSIGVTATWNIFQGGLVTSQVRQAKASYQQTLANYELQRRTADQNARNDFEGVMSGIAGIKANKQAVLSNQTSLDATKVGLRVGTRTEIDVLNAQQALASAQKSYYQSRYTYLDSLLALKQDAGRLNESDLAEIDGYVVATATASPPLSPAEMNIPEAPAAAVQSSTAPAAPAAPGPSPTPAPALKQPQ